MKARLILVALALAMLSACQSVPAQRKDNCACVWEPLTGLSKGATA
jgi:hypothetical protein